MPADVTLEMGEEQRQRMQERSLQDLSPPLKVPAYEGERFLGKGAFGEVWVAVNSNTGRKVAIKFYHGRGGLDWSLLAREVEKLRHLFADRYVVQLFEVGWDADPPYYVMEYMEHGSLEDRLRDGPLAVSEAVTLFREVAVGLMHAHSKGILHCDLKPGNILLDQDYKPRLADFGQSRLCREQSPALGTLFYMAPEQADLKAIPDARWDVYALGALLYHMLTGGPPYRTEAGATAILKSGALEQRLERYRNFLQTSPPPAAHRQVPGVDAALAALIDRCLAVDPRARYANVQAVLTALDARASRLARRPLLMLGTLGPALVMLVMALYATWLFWNTVNTARSELTDRALESNRFAAQYVAERCAAEISTRWAILEQEARDPRLRELLQQGAALKGNPAGLAALQQWIEERSRYWNQHFPAEMAASLWVVVDRLGYQRASHPVDGGQYLHQYFGYRDYFHGQGHNLDPDARPAPPPITEPYLSIPYRRLGKNAWTVAFSVPVRNLDPRMVEPIGVLVLTTDLGEFSRLRGMHEQFAALLDIRPDEQGNQGMIVEHPYLDRQRELGRVFRPVYNAKVVEWVERLGEGDGQHDYQDPASEVAAEFGGNWLATLARVTVQRGPREQQQQPGWVVLVQERPDKTLAPLQGLTNKLVATALQSAGMVIGVVGALWGVVLLMLKDPRQSRLLRFWHRLRGRTTETSASELKMGNSQLPSGSGHSDPTPLASGSGRQEAPSPGH